MNGEEFTLARYRRQILSVGLKTGRSDISPDDPWQVSEGAERGKRSINGVVARTWFAIAMVAREMKVFFSTTMLLRGRDTKNEVTFVSMLFEAVSISVL